MVETSLTSQEKTTLALGPFVGEIGHSSVKLWLTVEAGDADKNVFVTLKLLEQGPKSEAAKKDMKRIIVRTIASPVVVQSGQIRCRQADMGVGTITMGSLEPNSKYSYQLWQDEAHEIPLDLNPGKEGSLSDSSGGLQPEDLFFWTLPEDGYGRQLDFLLMSCHNPQTAPNDEANGFGVWRQIPQIIRHNANVRFAILAGDQIYADEVETQVLAERDPLTRKQLYLTTYKKFWDNEYYRKVLCSLPAVLMWDDHDITDGWGSREDSFRTDLPQAFTSEWLELFGTASEMFSLMQASRNPAPLSSSYASGFDTCFKVGKAGFVVADLRTNRNSRKFTKTSSNGKTVYEGQIWDPKQLQAIKDWVEQNKNDIHTLFFVTSVVFSHGAPQIENWIMDFWFRVLNFVKRLEKFRSFKKHVASFYSKVGDLRDDINDSWGSEVNQKEADRVLDFFFELENPADGGKRLNVVILSGDIHTPGYSTIYSSATKDNETRKVPEPEGEREGRAVIPHIVATPVAYEPFSWVGEAVFRHLTKVVKLGASGTYTSQVSHHFCYRNVVVVSLRNYESDESHLKVKYYLEGYPEPQVMLFDLNHGAHREAIKWPQQERNTWVDRLPECIKRRLPKSWFPQEKESIPAQPPTDAFS
ncbi:MAG TPA: alkaline phosphatase D family protein [Pyrinomonadaceae bacterium]|nr:alkaline phosphatase D family protein [Pyrinomonadaceae bacterium]